LHSESWHQLPVDLHALQSTTPFRFWQTFYTGCGAACATSVSCAPRKVTALQLNSGSTLSSLNTTSTTSCHQFMSACSAFGLHNRTLTVTSMLEPLLLLYASSI
jgi:hypothetical protein